MTSPKKVEKQYGHYSTTATTVDQEKVSFTWFLKYLPLESVESSEVPFLIIIFRMMHRRPGILVATDMVHHHHQQVQALLVPTHTDQEVRKTRIERNTYIYGYLMISKF